MSPDTDPNVAPVIDEPDCERATTQALAKGSSSTVYTRILVASDGELELRHRAGDWANFFRLRTLP